MLLPLTTLALAGLLWARPFAAMNSALDRLVGAAPEWTQVRALLRDPQRHETTSGELARQSYETLARFWGPQTGRRRVVFAGNSQMMTMSLAPGEVRPGPVERTYFDILYDSLLAKTGAPLCYRLAAGGLTYEEVLFNLHYFLGRAELKPDVLVLQINYQAFRMGGIREGLTDLLADPAMRAAVEEEAASGALYADEFRSTLDRFEHKAAEYASGTGVQEGPVVLGARLERQFRDVAKHSSLLEARHTQKEEFLDLLYRLRLYVLQLKPSTARSIAGSRLWRNRSCLERIAAVCRSQNVKLVLFLAPVNPRVHLFSSEEDRVSYRGYVTELAERFHLSLYDFEAAIPEQYWGSYYNSPDPLHMGRHGHALFAATLQPAVEKALSLP
ncbi:MAG: hypothetical protein IPJ98_02980 [Bryobacterales bacterium]|nr:hypothetical protein [Bryobacterales bacterium]